MPPHQSRKIILVPRISKNNNNTERRSGFLTNSMPFNNSTRHGASGNRINDSSLDGPARGLKSHCPRAVVAYYAGSGIYYRASSRMRELRRCANSWASHGRFRRRAVDRSAVDPADMAINNYLRHCYARGTPTH